jgi:hypothetical protein
MTCGEFKEQVAALALGLLDADERAACERHLTETEPHDGCVAALRQARETATLLALALPPMTPAPATWTAIEAGTHVLATAAPRRAPRLGTLAPWLLAAAALLFLAWSWRDRLTLRAAHDQDVARAAAETRARAVCVAERDALRRQAELQREALALLQRPGARLVALAQQGGATATASVIWHPERALVLGHGLTAPAGRDYELWVIRGERKIAAGLLRADASGGLISAIDPVLLREGAPDAFAVTLEAAGGKPQPEGPIVLVGKI